ncbi:MAG: 50S ribosomal protein L15 [Chloroflexia bacterium]
MQLNDLRPVAGANKDRKRVGRGHGSGHVKTAGKGTKGQKARSGGNVPPRFMGGQTPIHQQLPYKRGFTNIWKTRYNVLNVAQLAVLEVDTNTELTPDSLLEMGVLRNSGLPLKILGNGELDKAIRVSAHKVSEGARQKIEAAGGSVTVIEDPNLPKRSKGRTDKGLKANQDNQD